jgi:F0F1-type ATP synthase membrane subunit b/b'
MKIISGDVESLIGLVKKRIDNKIDELELSFEKNREEQLERAKSQAKQIRSKILEDAKRDAGIIHKEHMLKAKQEAKEISIKAKGKVEADIREEVKRELSLFVQGKRKIKNMSYEDLVSSVRKSYKGKLETEKTKDGVVLKTEGKELDLTVESMMRLLREIPMQEVIK